MNSPTSIPCPIACTFLSRLETSARRRSDRRAHLLGCADDGVALPVRVPEDERDPQRPHERRRQHRVQRNHVRNDADGTRAQLACQRCREPSASLGLRARAELSHASIRRHRRGDRRVAKHDQLVDPRRERAHHRHCRREHRIVRIELLRREDQLAHQKKSMSPSVKCHASRRFGSSGASSVKRLPMKRILRGVGHEARGEIRALLAGVDHRDRDVGVDRLHAHAQELRPADRLAHDRRGVAVPDRVGHDRPAGAVFDAQVWARRVGVAPVEIAGITYEVMRVVGDAAGEDSDAGVPKRSLRRVCAAASGGPRSEAT